MEKIKNITLGIVVIGLIGLTIAVFNGSDTISLTTEQMQGVAELLNNKLGALTGPDLPYNWFSVGGVRTYQNSIPLIVATSTSKNAICSIQSPAASSTLAFWSVQITNASSTASILTVAKSGAMNATTTFLAKQAVTANQKMYVASTTGATTGGLSMNEDRPEVFGPSQWFVIGQSGGSAGQVFNVTGNCKAVFVEN